MREKLPALCERLLDAGCRYAEVRWEENNREHLLMENGKVRALESRKSAGFAIRVLKDGCWGFASTNIPRNLEKAAYRALQMAEAARVAAPGIRLAEADFATEDYRTPLQKDPFQIPWSERMDLLREAQEKMLRQSGVRLAGGHITFQRRQVVLYNTDLRRPLEQEITVVGAGIYCLAFRDGQPQRRSYPQSHDGAYATGGWEMVERWNLPAAAPRIAEEAVAITQGPLTPRKRTTLVAGCAQMALQIHESIGHALELDRILGWELSFAGGSWVKPQDFGRLRYGSPLLNVRADSTSPGGLGTFGFDDEGVRAQERLLIQGGIVVDALSSRDSAALAGRRPLGCARASHWNRMPMVRMVNVSLLPGKGSLEDLISTVDEGIFVDINRSWSIDHQRLNFQFATEYAREIRGGRLGKLLRNPVYWGITPEFWGSLRAIAGPEEWVLWGVPNCGKGDPVQVIGVSHGAAPCVFENVEVAGRE